jgi:diketogulonate reductase-like aldo/keto reductase
MASIINPNQQEFALNNGSGQIPALGFGTSLSDNTHTRNAVKAAVQVGFRHLDAAERYRNEAEVGAALKELFADGTVRREDFVCQASRYANPIQYRRGWRRTGICRSAEVMTKAQRGPSNTIGGAIR